MLPKPRTSLRAALVAALAWWGLAPSPAAAQGEACLACHDKAQEAVEARHQVDAQTWVLSVHAQAGIGCESCHLGKFDEVPHQLSGDRWAACADCHGDAASEFAASIHGQARQSADPWPIDCASCHGSTHTLKPASDPESPLHPKRVAETCGTCHADPKMAERPNVRRFQPLSSYLASVHARGVERGEHAATCADCHGRHGVFRAGDARSTVHHERVPETCGACHAEITKAFAESVHGRAAAAGVRQAPVCTDCHGEHKILGPAERGSPVFASNVPKMTCGRCHGDLRVTESFGLEGTTVSAFEDSFHGLAGRAGSASVANCASCHGVHDILPSSDPRSHVSKANLAATCGSCHPGAGTRFAIGPVHVLPADPEKAHPAVYWVRSAYLWLIWLTIGGMVLHNVLDFRRKVLSHLPRTWVPVAERRPRLNAGFRIAHAATAVSFIVLAVTGFALKYPDSWWAAPLLAWEGHFGLRGWLHRAAAIVMLAAFAFHLVHLILDRRARACIAAMRPTLEDLHELKERFAWYFGKTATMPKAPALGYIEKAEYLALMWGTLVMAATGFLLWFNDWTLANLPTWVADVATVVHFYEAVLATLAILVWHFYFVLADPLIYPMDTAWLTGKEPPGRTLERHRSTIES